MPPAPAPNTETLIFLHTGLSPTPVIFHPNLILTLPSQDRAIQGTQEVWCGHLAWALLRCRGESRPWASRPCTRPTSPRHCGYRKGHSKASVQGTVAEETGKEVMASLAGARKFGLIRKSSPRKLRNGKGLRLQRSSNSMRALCKRGN